MKEILIKGRKNKGELFLLITMQAYWYFVLRIFGSCNYYSLIHSLMYWKQGYDQLIWYVISIVVSQIVRERDIYNRAGSHIMKEVKLLESMK